MNRSMQAGDDMLYRFPRTDARYWKSRLIQRKYTEQIKFIARGEYSTRIEHGGVSFFFPLGSDNEDRAAAKALEVYETVVREGWPAAVARYPREIAVAIFWTWSPMACSYTTLYTLQGNEVPAKGCRAESRARTFGVGVIESDDGIRRALQFWIDRQPGYCCRRTFSSIRQAVPELRGEPPELVLVNRDLVENPGTEGMNALHASFPDLPVFGFGIYEESNYIFHSVTGVKAGYVLHRRLPTQLFDPISPLPGQARLQTPALSRQIKRYFQGLFDLPADQEKDQELTNLTKREHEILLCLSRGFTDKEIADALSISVWTVHGHVKKVFEKMRVHSRTEAVIKFLQK
jgi:DNA-binding NarL/FixJ family response regulator